ncbi:MAG: hypothetical protein JNG88_01645 [Phycisphaerales bacterium]|nr:hypothetical protein [Phycisphaerales bacterium]
MLNKLYAITWTTFFETVRQPVYSILMWTAAFWIAVFGPSLSAFTLESGKDVKVLQDVGMATLMLFGLLVSVFSATHVITREIETRSILTVVSKPVPRPLFLVGKFLGVTGAVFVAYYFLCLVIFMSVRHGVMEMAADKLDQPVIVLGLLAIGISLVTALFCNYFYGWHFTATLTACVVPLGTLALIVALFFDKTWKPQEWSKDFGNLQLIYAVSLIYVAVMILTAFAVTLATRFNQVLTLVLCAAVFMVGLLSDHYLGTRVNDAPIFNALYAMAPKMQFFWVGDALTQELVIQFDHVKNVAIHGVVYTLAVLSLGVAMFQTREVS